LILAAPGHHQFTGGRQDDRPTERPSRPSQGRSPNTPTMKIDEDRRDHRPAPHQQRLERVSELPTSARKDLISTLATTFLDRTRPDDDA